MGRKSRFSSPGNRAAYRIRCSFRNTFLIMSPNTKGFTVLFAALIPALLLAVGLAIFDIIFKEVSFATVARDSNYAIYAADTGAECAEYWDQQCGATCNAGFTSAFSTSTFSASNPPVASGVPLLCAGQDIRTANASVITNNGDSPFMANAVSATTTFA